MKKIFLSIVFVIVVLLGVGYVWAWDDDGWVQVVIDQVGPIDALVTYNKNGERECDGVGIIRVPFGQIFSTCGRSWFVTMWGQVITVEDDGGVVGRISRAIEEDQPLVLLDQKEITLPSDYHEAQEGSVYQLGDLLFVFVLQKNINTPLLDLPADLETRWGGVLVSGDGGVHWQSLLMYENPVDDTEVVVRHNPVGMFVKGGILFVNEGQLVIDVVDGRGAGSGEGILTRFVLLKKEQNWIKVGCYYFMPEIYYDESRGPFQLETSGECLSIPLEG